MPQLPERAIDEFQALWKQHYGEELPREEAVGHAHKLVALLRMLIKDSEPPARA